MSNQLGRAALAVLVVLCGVTLVLGFANKDRCTGPEFDQWGRSGPDYTQRSYSEVCYSDIQHLWLGRDIDRHVFPYVNGDFERGRLTGGTVEYPVLTGLTIWAGALFVDTDAGFLLASALLMAPFGLLTAWLLGKLAGWRALIWALGPPMVLYAFHNWDLPVVCCSVAAFFVMQLDRWDARKRQAVAAVLLGLGFAVKLYPAIFVVPLALTVLTQTSGRYDLRGALRVVWISAATGVGVNVPFALVGFQGWWASFEFQGERKVDVSTNSIWYWAFRPISESDDTAFQSLMSVLSPTLMLASFGLACYLGWRRYLAEGSYPFIPVSAAMLCGFLLLHKVHSPQYTLWLLPMFVLLRIRWEWIAAYFLADLAMGIGIFRWFGEMAAGHGTGIHDGFAAQAVMIGVWGRAALLVALFFVFLRAESVTREGPASLSGGSEFLDVPARVGAGRQQKH